jgi:hypothetical protein
VPIVVNSKILGGWKYVNAFTGVFFNDEVDVVTSVRECLSYNWRPSHWYRANYGPFIAGRRLLQLLRSLDPAIAERSHAFIMEPTLTLERATPGDEQ